VHIGEPHQEVAGSLFGLVELSGMNEFGHGVGGIHQFVVALQCILGDTELCGDGGFQLVDPLAFTKADRRTQRRSDGTIVVEGNRFEVPNRYRHFTPIGIRYASWDLAHIHLVDEPTGQVLCRLFPQDKTRNASGLRRPLDPVSPQPVAAVPPASGIAPLLAKLIDRQAASGLPPPYLPKDEQGDDT
jgi:hypothetical protein